MPKRPVTYKLGMDSKGFDQGAKKALHALDKIDKKKFTGVSKQAHSATQNIKASFASLVKAGMGLSIGSMLMHSIARGIRRAAHLIPEALEASLEGQRIDAQLKAQLERIGAPGAFGALDELSSKLQRAFNIDDESIRSGFTQMIRSGMNVTKIMQTASLAADIAKAKKLDYAEASKVVALAYNGETRSLRQFGIVIAQTGSKRKDAVAAMKTLQAAFGGQGTAIAAKENPWVAMKLAIADSIQLLGDKLAPVLLPLIQRVTDFVFGLLSTGTLDRWFAHFTAIATNVVQFVKSLLNLENLKSAAVGLLQALLIVAVKMVWDAIKLVGRLLWTGITQGLPALTTTIAVSIGEAAMKALGPTLTRAFGTEGRVNELRKARDRMLKTTSQSGVSAISDFARSTATNAIGAARSMPSFIDRSANPMQSLAAIANAGAQERARAQAEAYAQTATADQIGWSQRAEQMDSASKNKVAQFVENQNAKTQMRKPIKLQITSYDQSIHPVAGLT